MEHRGVVKRTATREFLHCGSIEVTMTRKFAAVFILTVSFITNLIAYGEFQDQLRNYYDTVYQRSFQQNSEEAEDVNLRMPGVHPEKVSKLGRISRTAGKLKYYPLVSKHSFYWAISLIFEPCLER